MSLQPVPEGYIATGRKRSSQAAIEAFFNAATQGANQEIQVKIPIWLHAIQVQMSAGIQNAPAAPSFVDPFFGISYRPGGDGAPGNSNEGATQFYPKNVGKKDANFSDAVATGNAGSNSGNTFESDWLFASDLKFWIVATTGQGNGQNLDQQFITADIVIPENSIIILHIDNGPATGLQNLDCEMRVTFYYTPLRSITDNKLPRIG